MKRSLARVKQQLADLRPGKTEALSEELQAADKRVEYLRETLQTLSKALPLPATGDKRPKKGPDYAVYNLLKNDKLLNSEDGAGSLIHSILMKYTDMFYNIAEEMSTYEQEVDKNVSSPLHKLLETDISKLKKNLNKHVSDRETASNRLQTAQSRHSEINNKHHLDPSKLSSLQDDVEEAGQRVEQASDQLAHDMFTLLAKEPEIANYLLLHVKLRHQYYENALDVLDRLIPEIEHLINTSEVRPVFNCPLEDHLRVTKRKIALPIELCVCAIMEHGIAEEGLFRVAGGASKLRRLKLSIDASCLTLPLPPEYKDIHLFAGILKCYLRELPEPLLTFGLYDEWMRAGRILNEEGRVAAIQDILSNLPKENYDNLRYLVKFLSKLSKNSQNKMSSHNIAIVMSPNLLWGRSEPDLDDLSYTSRAVDTLVSQAEVLFPGETEIYLTYKWGEIFGPETVNKVATHVRNNSNDTNITLDHDTVSNYSLSENSSPKPVTRRKNKPAPEPPKADYVELNKIEKPQRPSVVSGTATVNRSTYKAPKTQAHDIEVRMTQSSATPTVTDDVPTSVHMRRKSLDFDHTSLQAATPPYVKQGGGMPNKKEHGHLSKNDISEPTLISNTATTPVKDLTEPHIYDTPFSSLPSVVNSIPTANVNQITAQTISVGKITVTSDNLQQKSNINFNMISPKPLVRPPPIAAPRPSLVEQKTPTNKSSCAVNTMTKSLNEIDLGAGDVVELRRPNAREELSALFERGVNKPTVPERPPSLRPASFRAPRQCLEQTADVSITGGTMLERAVVYNVPDKQQVSIVQFKDKEKPPPGHDNQITEKEKFLGHQPTPPNQFNQVIEKNALDNEPTEPPMLLQQQHDILLDNQNVPLQRRKSLGGKPVRPPKPDVSKSNERLNMMRSNERLNIVNSNVLANVTNESSHTKPSHLRTMSDGNIVESSSKNSSECSSPMSPPMSPALASVAAATYRPSSPRGPSRPPRPQPPPPPPPVAKQRLSTESTDL